ncbi:hypothetical protein [Streptomyces mobaraensis]|uniref:Uncharacterized protein n=1 Tax=Streptomyces mobaraensis TaxID=35621 RepID=A0A5N5VZE0_STRMB|nr:hypothetical protein [Streptomyces mobaraensis]KAB7833540.1 hypothetical protein FRZ00_33370 [Streptomyces mobaraensis]
MESESPFWNDLLKLRDPAWTDPTEAQQRKLTQDVRRLADALGGEIWSRAEEIAELTDMPAARETVIAHAPDRHLATLRALRAVKDAADAAADDTARKAGQIGAGYPQLGRAWNITRQAARLRWPGAVSVISPASNREPRHFEMYGGEARVAFHPEFGGWWWVATAANRKRGEAPEDVTYDTSEEAAAAAGVFLAANTDEGAST